MELRSRKVTSSKRHPAKCLNLNRKYFNKILDEEIVYKNEYSYSEDTRGSFNPFSLFRNFGLLILLFWTVGHFQNELEEARIKYTELIIRQPGYLIDYFQTPENSNIKLSYPGDWSLDQFIKIEPKTNSQLNFKLVNYEQMNYEVSRIVSVVLKSNNDLHKYTLNSLGGDLLNKLFELEFRDTNRTNVYSQWFNNMELYCPGTLFKLEEFVRMDEGNIIEFEPYVWWNSANKINHYLDILIIRNETLALDYNIPYVNVY